MSRNYLNNEINNMKSKCPLYELKKLSIFYAFSNCNILYMVFNIKI